MLETITGTGRDKSEHRNKRTERWALTYWRRHREGQVRTQEESHRARGTHTLETALGWTCQDTKRIPPSEGHSHPGDGIGRDRSGHRKNPIERGALTFWRRHGEGQVRTQKNPTERGALTFWRQHREGQVRTQKESHRAMGTHPLETASGRTSQYTQRIPPSDGHSHTGDGIGRDKSGYRKNPTER